VRVSSPFFDRKGERAQDGHACVCMCVCVRVFPRALHESSSVLRRCLGGVHFESRRVML
jgi:hypothetical protein